MNDRILNKAIELASQLQNKKQRLCAIVTNKRGHILNIGFNSYNKTSTTQAYYAEKVGAITEGIYSCRNRVINKFKWKTSHNLYR